jgi:hypothetical protein
MPRTARGYRQPPPTGFSLFTRPPAKGLEEPLAVSLGDQFALTVMELA